MVMCKELQNGGSKQCCPQDCVVYVMGDYATLDYHNMTCMFILMSFVQQLSREVVVLFNKFS